MTRRRHVVDDVSLKVVIPARPPIRGLFRPAEIFKKWPVEKAQALSTGHAQVIFIPVEDDAVLDAAV